VTSGVAQTQAEAAVMESTATKFESANSSLQSTLTKLMDRLTSLQTAWQGAGGKAFEQVKLQYEADQKALSNALTETASAIRTSGTAYTTSDTEAASRVVKSNSGLSLPL
jgi:WXG100 family type VII secretion target